MDNFDYVEFNTNNYRYEDNLKAIALAKKYNKPVLIGEDTHTVSEISERGYNLIPVEMTLQEAIDSDKVLPVLHSSYPLDQNNPQRLDKKVLGRRFENSLRIISQNHPCLRRFLMH